MINCFWWYSKEMNILVDLILARHRSISEFTVNGTDVSSFPHEDAVRTFLTAQEPIVVEVKRRITEEFQVSGNVIEDNIPTQIPPSSSHVSTGVQTEFSDFAWIDDNTLEFFSHDIDLEEVTLRKCSSDEKLGLTVCYSSSSEADTCTEVYIRDIAPQSVADRDGRLRQGDQILQVNGKDVANKEETESLFAENRKAVTLLVSRCYNKSEEYLDTDVLGDVSPTCKSAAYQNSIIEQLVQQQTESYHSAKTDVPPHIPPHFMQDILTNSLVRSKLDSINHEISELNHRMHNIQLVKTDKRKTPQLPHIAAPLESDTEHIYETIPESVDSELEPIYSCPYEASDENIVEQWLKTQESEWTPQAKDILTKEPKIEKSRSKSSKSNSSGEEHENSSSAYNTGGSCNSNPLTFELACNLDLKQKDIYKSSLIFCAPSESQEVNGCETGKLTKQKFKTKGTGPKAMRPSSPTVRPIANPPVLSDTMYTNVANLEQTILLQQQLFRQALGQTTTETNKPTTSFTSQSLNQYQIVGSQQNYSSRTDTTTMNTAMEWKVKRRPDGTRYIARRPVRNRILRNREIRLSEERAGLTTEDDTISELKIGRYWTKEERKKHLEKSKERKQRQEILLASRNIDENNDILFQKTLDKNHCLMNKKLANNIDNTVKKHKSNKKLQKDVYDNISTVQDVLVHGNKVGTNQNGKMIGLLSVTTV